MSPLLEQKRNLVRFFFKTLYHSNWRERFFLNERLSGKGTLCTFTRVFVPSGIHQLIKTKYGMAWIGLWLNEPIPMNDDGNAVFPSWLADVLKEEGYDIDSSNIVQSHQEIMPDPIYMISE